MSRGMNYKGPRWRYFLVMARGYGARLWASLGRMRGFSALKGRGRNRRITGSTRRFEEGKRPSLRKTILARLGSPKLKRFGRNVLLSALPVLVAALGFAAPVFGVKAYRYVMQTGHFYVKDVLVDGNNRLTFDEVRELTELRPNTHLLATDLGAMERKLKAHPWVASARVQRELPDRLIIAIEEHVPVAYVTLGELWVVNRSGVPFTNAKGLMDLDLPIITGLSREALNHEETRQDARARIRTAVSLAHLYGSLSLNNRWPLGEIRVGPAGRYSLVLSEDGTEVALGHEPYRDKLYKLEWVLENLRRQERVADYVLLDLSRDGFDDGRVIVKADVAPSMGDKARESSRFALPAGARDDASKAKKKVEKQKRKRRRRLKRRRQKQERKHHILPGPVQPHESFGRGA